MTLKNPFVALLGAFALLVAPAPSPSVRAESPTAETPPKVVVEIDGVVRQPSFGTVAGSWFYNAGPDGSQVLLLGFPKGGVEQAPNYRLVADLNSESVVRLTVPVAAPRELASAKCFVKQLGTIPASVGWSRGSQTALNAFAIPRPSSISADFSTSDEPLVLTIYSPKFDAESTSNNPNANTESKRTCAVEI
ncbi:MAG: hypothetical protein IJE77_12050, partial [Thermoguttaceae bacterium]|nr:hypothetical protein [Thermoguttaceae bacterium]